jgi:hypothetical protein
VNIRFPGAITRRFQGLSVCAGISSLLWATAWISPAGPPATASSEAALGAPITTNETAAWQAQRRDKPARRCRIQPLPNGGWSFIAPEGIPLAPIGIEYEPLAMYGRMNRTMIQRDLDLIAEAGFNTVTVWVIDFHAAHGNGIRMSIADMVNLAEMAADRHLYIQFYLNIDRFIQLFPTAVTADGQAHHFDIDFHDPGFRTFTANFARRLAMALYPFANVSSIVVWEEKIGLSREECKDKVIIRTLYGSDARKKAFAAWLEERHHSLEKLNRTWETDYGSFASAVDRTLLDYYNGVSDTDHRQFDILEFGQIMLIDFTRNFINAYKSIDPGMLFQCRNWDLFGPERPLHPDYAFLDTFGINNYSLGFDGHDLSFREELLKAKLVAGVTRTAPCVGNFGFRTETADGAVHGIVPDNFIKADMGADSQALFSAIPEMAGTSYFMYYFPVPREGPFGIIEDLSGKPLPIFHAFKAMHTLMRSSQATFALSDYAQPPAVYLFWGLDAAFSLRQQNWKEHICAAYDLMDMNLNYGVITDAASYDPAETPVIWAILHGYDQKLDRDISESLIRFCREGGTLVVANQFGAYDRYLHPVTGITNELRQLRGIALNRLCRGHITVRPGGKTHGLPPLKLSNTWYVTAQTNTLAENAEVLMNMDVQEQVQPALIRQNLGRGQVFYFLFNPYQWWGGTPRQANRTSLPIMHFVLSEIGISHDTSFGNRGFELTDGRINVHEEPIHYSISYDIDTFGSNRDVYGEDDERYSGGLFTDNFISFRGRQFTEQGWHVNMSAVSSMGAGVTGNTLRFFTTAPVTLQIHHDAWHITHTTESFRVYRINQP